VRDLQQGGQLVRALLDALFQVALRHHARGNVGGKALQGDNLAA
jgi:hypothetical protein